MPPSDEVKVLERCRISISPPPSSLPLTFFDLVFSRFHPVQRLFFYNFSRSKLHFLNSELPKLKRSLSLALSHFYPLAGRLTSEGSKPEIHCSEDDFVEFVVAISNDDFFDLSGNHFREARRFRPLIPSPLSKETVLSTQVTVFPNAGITIGTTFHHAAGDGSTYTHFMKTWAAMCKTKMGPIPDPLPFYDRSMIGDPKGLKDLFLKDLESLKEDRSLEVWDLEARSDVVRATFVLGRDQLGELSKDVELTPRCSSYALVCGRVWACLVRARGDTSKKSVRFGFVTGCRARLEPALPAAYFGNCLGICCVETEREEIVGEKGAAKAAAVIWRKIKKLEEGAFHGAENWIRDVYDYASARALTVAGSPKLGIYEVDFGWGRPEKVEVISIERTGAMSLAESKVEAGGIEIGLALPRHEMEEFVSLFVDGLPDNGRNCHLQ